MELTDPELVRSAPTLRSWPWGDFDVLATFRQYARRIGFVHLKDLDVNRPWEITGARGGPSTWSDTSAYHVDSKWRFVEMHAPELGIADVGAGVEPYNTLVRVAGRPGERCFAP